MKKVTMFLLSLLLVACTTTTTSTSLNTLSKLTPDTTQKQVFKHEYISDNLNDFKFYNELRYSNLSWNNNLACSDDSDDNNNNYLVRCIENVYSNEKGFVVELMHDFCILNRSEFRTKARQFLGSTVYNDMADARLFKDTYKKYILVNTENKLVAVVNIKNYIVQDKDCIKKSKCIQKDSYGASNKNESNQRVTIALMSNTLHNYAKQIHEIIKHNQITDNKLIFKNLCGKIAFVNYKKRFLQQFQASDYIESLYENSIRHELVQLAFLIDLEKIKDEINNLDYSNHLIYLDLNHNNTATKYFKSLKVNVLNALQVNDINLFVKEFFEIKPKIKYKKYIDGGTGYELNHIYFD